MRIKLTTSVHLWHDGWNSTATITTRSTLMTMIDQVATAMQAILTTTAYRLGRTTGFVQRESKLNGAVFTETLVFTYLANPEATLDELTHTAATMGVAISAPGLDQRFTPQAADLLQQVLAAALTRMLSSQSWDLPILSQFTHVLVEDSTLIALPPELADLWRGCGTATKQATAALKLTLRMDLLTGLVETLTLHPGHLHDSTTAAPSTTVPAGALYLADLGFFRLTRMVELAAQSALVLSRFKLHTIVWTADGQRWDDIVALLDAQGGTVVDQDIWLGAQRTVAGRLVAVAAPQEVVDQRRRRLRADARRDGRTVSAAQLAAAAWSIFFTTVPRERLSVAAVLVVARARWQIELVFKTWKSHGQIDQSRSGKPWRVMCDVYAKLLAMVVSHWVSLIEVWGYPDRSLVKAAQVIEKHAMRLAEAVHGWDQVRVCETLTTIARVLATGCRMNTRKAKPNTYQLLLAVAEHLLP